MSSNHLMTRPRNAGEACGCKRRAQASRQTAGGVPTTGTACSDWRAGICLLCGSLHSQAPTCAMVMSAACRFFQSPSAMSTCGHKAACTKRFGCATMPLPQPSSPVLVCEPPELRTTSQPAACVHAPSRSADHAAEQQPTSPATPLANPSQAAAQRTGSRAPAAAATVLAPRDSAMRSRHSWPKSNSSPSPVPQRAAADRTAGCA